MNPRPTGLSQSSSSVSSATGNDLAITVATSVAVTGAGFGLVAFGATHLNPAAILPGVALAVEGVVSLATLAAGGGSKEVVQVREGFKFTATNIVETGVLKAAQSVASMLSTDNQGKRFADALGAAKNVATIIRGRPDADSAIGVIKDTAELAKFVDERAAQTAERYGQEKAMRKESETGSTESSERKNEEISEPTDEHSAPKFSCIPRPEGDRRFTPDY